MDDTELQNVRLSQAVYSRYLKKRVAKLSDHEIERGSRSGEGLGRAGRKI